MTGTRRRRPRIARRPLPDLLTALLPALLIASAGAAAATETTGASASATGISRLSNPAISVNALFAGRTSRDDSAAEANRIDLQEAELRFTSMVDPFWKADLTLAVHPEHAEDEHEEGHDHGARHYAVDVETANISAQRLPSGLGLRLGKFYLPFGKHSRLHTHQYPFSRAPVAVEAFLGDHGLTDVGAEAAYNLPLPWWSEVKAYGVDGDGIFDIENRDLAYGARWENLFDLNDETTVEIGGSGLRGPAAAGGDLDLLGFDLTLKWISGARSHGPALNWTNELILPDADSREGDPLGFYSHLRYRAGRDWWVGLGAGLADAAWIEPGGHHDEEADEPHAGPDLREYRANLTYSPSEFSFLRAEVSYREESDGDYEDLSFAVQWCFTIGSHPAHEY